MNAQQIRTHALGRIRDIEARNTRKPGGMTLRDRDDHQSFSTIVGLCDEILELRAKLEAP